MTLLLVDQPHFREGSTPKNSCVTQTGLDGKREHRKKIAQVWVSREMIIEMVDMGGVEGVNMIKYIVGSFQRTNKILFLYKELKPLFLKIYFKS